MTKFKSQVIQTLMITALAMLSRAETAQANGQIKYGANRSKSVAAAPSFVEAMQCMVDKFQGSQSSPPQGQKYEAKEIGCFGSRPHNRSAHPTGHACDVDQTSRNVARINQTIKSPEQIKIATACQAVSGCIWRNPDCGHFEQRSAPYSPAGARTGGHYYGEGNRDRVRRRG